MLPGISGCTLARYPPGVVTASQRLADMHHPKPSSSASQRPAHVLPQSLSGLWLICSHLACVRKREKIGHFTGAKEGRERGQRREERMATNLQSAFHQRETARRWQFSPTTDWDSFTPMEQTEGIESKMATHASRRCTCPECRELHDTSNSLGGWRS